MGAAALAGCTPGRPDNATTRENALPGDTGWKVPADGVTDLAGQIQGYASATSVNRGESIDFSARLSDRDYQPVDGAEITVTITATDSLRTRSALSFTSS